MKRNNKPYGELPSWLKNGNVITVNRSDDYGPATKYIPTLEYYNMQPERQILVIDDDIILPSGAIRTIHELANKFPNQVVTGHGILISNKNICNLNPSNIFIG